MELVEKTGRVRLGARSCMAVSACTTRTSSSYSKKCRSERTSTSCREPDPGSPRLRAFLQRRQSIVFMPAPVCRHSRFGVLGKYRCGPADERAGPAELYDGAAPRQNYGPDKNKFLCKSANRALCRHQIHRKLGKTCGFH